MENILNFDIVTTPGEVAYEQSSEEMAVLFVLSIISEGYKEEPKYLEAIRKICKQKDVAQIAIHLINRHYKRQEESAGRNHPLKRFADLVDWKNNHTPFEGIENKDEYWLICDRDNDTFTSEQYDQLVEKCQKEGVNIIISNPAFQIWLLLHFTNELSSYNLEQYEKSSDCIKHGVEPAIKVFVPRYKHGKLNVNTFVPLIKTALINCTNYSYSIEKLRDTIGTNFNVLLNRIEEVSGVTIFNETDV